MTERPIHDNFAKQLLVVLLCLLAGAVARAADPPAPSLEQRLTKILTDPGAFKKTTASMLVVEYPSGRTVFAHNSRTPLLPASNQKLLTTAAALEKLGANWPLTTRIFYDGKLQDDTVVGDLVVQGAGDPSIAGRCNGDDPAEILTDWAGRIRARGIRRITGGLVIDDRIFDRQFVHPAWPAGQLNQWYCAPVAGMSINDNCFDLLVSPADAPGKPAQLKSPLPTPFVRIVNKTRTVKKSRKVPHPKVGLYPDWENGTVTIRGLVPLGDYRPLRVPCALSSPPLFFAGVFKTVLREAGIAVEGPVRLVENNESFIHVDDEVLVEHKTTVAEIVRITNSCSQNVYAESLLKLMGERVQPQGTFAAGAKQAELFLRKNVGVNPREFSVSDGSGLSRKNRISAHALVEVMQFMARSRNSEPFLKSLSIMGVRGTAASRLADSPAKGKVLVKTGYIRGVSALTGLVRTRGGGLFVFSFLTNDIPGGTWKVKHAYDKACEAIYLYGD